MSGADPVETWLAAARAALGAGDPAGAARALARLVALAPGNDALIGDFAGLLAAAGAGPAGPWAKRAWRLDPSRPDRAHGLARDLVARGAPGDAALILARALALNPRDGALIGLLGAARSSLRDLTGAARAFDRAARLDPDDPRAMFALGGALQAASRTLEAEVAFDAAALRRWRALGRPLAPDAGPRVGLGWKPGNTSGWQVYGDNFLKRVAARGRWAPVIVDPVVAAGPDPGDPHGALIADSLGVVAPTLAAGARYDFPILVALGNDFGRFPHLGRSRREIGIMFIEHTDLSPEGRDDAARYERIVAGSTWCAEIVRAMGFDNVDTIIQGIDPGLFSASPRRPRSGPFRIFSGGKIEHRKGQDIVVAAFRRFHQRHPDSRLVTCWHSAVPQAAASVTWGGLIDRPPDIGADGRLDLVTWLGHLGIPAEAVEDLGLVPNQRLPEILAGVDAAVFTNRCEGGTNLPAMEAMAMGVPTILSANTGHLDLIEAGNCLPLRRQRAVNAPWIPGTDGWGDSDVDEVVAMMERLYEDPSGANAMGLRGAETLARLTWAGQMDRLLDLIASLG